MSQKDQDAEALGNAFDITWLTVVGSVVDKGLAGW
jgi:hypothetical protein